MQRGKSFRKALIIVNLFGILCIGVFFIPSQTVSAQEANMPLRNFGSTILVAKELSSGQIISIDGQKDTIWKSMNSEDLSISTEAVNTVDLSVYACIDGTSLYFLVDMQLLRASRCKNESISFNFLSTSTINYTMAQSTTENFPPGNRTGIPPTGDTPGTPPAGDFTGTMPNFDPTQFNTGSFRSRSDYNISKIDDRKVISIKNGFDTLETKNYTTSFMDQYVFTDYNEEESTYSYENDMDSSDAYGSAYMDPYGRFYELQMDLDPRFSEDLAFSDTEACQLYIGIQSSEDSTEFYTQAIQIQLFEPSIEEATEEEEEVFPTETVAIILFCLIGAVTVVLGAFVYVSKSNLKNNSFFTVFRDVTQYFKEEEEFGQVRSKEEMEEVNQEEREFLSWLNEDEEEEDQEFDQDIEREKENEIENQVMKTNFELSSDENVLDIASLPRGIDNSIFDPSHLAMEGENTGRIQEDANSLKPEQKEGQDMDDIKMTEEQMDQNERDFLAWLEKDEQDISTKQEPKHKTEKRQQIQKMKNLKVMKLPSKIKKVANKPSRIKNVAKQQSKTKNAEPSKALDDDFFSNWSETEKIEDEY